MNGADVRVYSNKKNGTDRIVRSCANFKVNEFACSDGSDVVFVSPDLVKVLQQIRDYFKLPVTVNSGYRTPGHNKKVGGAEYSQHLYGMAADISVKGVKPERVYEYVDSLLKNTGGVGLYDTFVHVDVRKVKSRWNG